MPLLHLYIDCTIQKVYSYWQVELQQAETASEDKAAALQADIAHLQERLAAAEADLAAAQARVQQLEQQLQAQQAEAAATEKRMNAQVEQLKMDVSCFPLCCTMHTLCVTFCFCICLLMPCVSPLTLGHKGVQRSALAEPVACACILTSLELDILSLEVICKAALKIKRLTAWFKDQSCTVDRTAAALPHLVYADSTVVTSVFLCTTDSLI